MISTATSNHWTNQM